MSELNAAHQRIDGNETRGFTTWCATRGIDLGEAMSHVRYISDFCADQEEPGSREIAVALGVMLGWELHAERMYSL